MMPILPSVFISHGAPTIILEDSPVRRFWRALTDDTGMPQAVLCVSAHWITETPAVSSVENPETIHDFYGFPKALYKLSYPAPGATDLAGDVVSLLEERALKCRMDEGRGLDHGAWIPLMEMFPDSEIPVTQLSIQTKRDMAHHIDIGQALAPLREKGVLILASGGAVHNFQGFHPGSQDAPDWAREFDDKLATIVEDGNEQALVNYRDALGAMAHPTDEHLLPLGVAWGSAGGAKGRILHRGFMDGAMSTAAFAFG